MFNPRLIKEYLDGFYKESLTYSTMKNWAELRFSREIVKVMGHDSRLLGYFTMETIVLIKEEVLSDSHLKIVETAARPRFSKSTIHRTFHDHFHMGEVSPRRVKSFLRC